MAKEQTWQVNIDGTEHKVTYVRQGLRSNASTLFVDDGEGKLFWPRDGYLDEPIIIGGKECRFVMRGYNADVVVDGVCVDSGKPYVPIEEVPVWCRCLTAGLIIVLFLMLRNMWLAIIASGIAWLGTDRISHYPGLPYKKKIGYYLALLAIVLIASIVITIVRSHA